MTNPDTPAIRLPSGAVLALPLPPMLQEFALPGNFRSYEAAGFLAFYDETTGTGAIYYLAHATWALQQPVLRDVFWLHCDVLTRVPDAAEIVRALKADADVAKPH